jgi:chitin disaccharide deacetylase
MKPNPVLRRLGFSDNDRVAILHTDDIGMCQASVTAFTNLWQFGLVSSGAVMMPCPWAYQAVNAAGQFQNVDLGVHSTITSEWPLYRWGPLSTRDPQSGLMDPYGFLFQSTREVQERADPESVQVELEAQVQQALRFGLRPLTWIRIWGRSAPCGSCQCIFPWR